MKIRPPADPVELAAALEATKLVAFLALSVAMATIARLKEDDEEAIREHMNGLKQRFIRDFKEASVELSPEAAAKFRDYGEATIEAMFSRLTVGSDPMNPMSS